MGSLCSWGQKRNKKKGEVREVVTRITESKSNPRIDNDTLTNVYPGEGLFRRLCPTDTFCVDMKDKSCDEY